MPPKECHQLCNKGIFLGRKEKPQHETNKLWIEKFTGRGKHRAKVGNHPHTNTSSKPGMGEESINAAYWKCNGNYEISNLKQFCLNTDCYIKTPRELKTENLQ